ncbi:fish-egg lectin-like [Erpetoichthys calabaricus]|uniref:fish-egg lectin-like n=1 Tax=Erpetoichthys calabaricus TaxID=27687 RepID=UPI0022341329|nr:fish-egg lectin-like [Erpetoichthys calabaricus]
MKSLLILIAFFISSSVALNCQQVAGSLQQIDAGLGMVVGVNSNDNIYILFGGTWVQLPGALQHVTVGPAGLWGVNSANQIYKMVNGNWVQVPGLLQQIDAGGDEFVAGVNMNDNVYCMGRNGAMGITSNQSPAPWELLPGALKYYSCGPISCWGINSANKIFIMRAVTPTYCTGSRWWQNIPGSLTMIEVSVDGSVYGVNGQGNVYRRDGITARNPAGTVWTQITISGVCQHVSYDLGKLWVIKNDGSIWTCS